MSMRKIMYLLIGVGAVVLIIALAGRRIESTTESVTDDFRFEAAKLKDKTVWTQVNPEPYYISKAVDSLCRALTAKDFEHEQKENPHEARFITVYVNNIGRAAMFSKRVAAIPGRFVNCQREDRHLSRWA
jgi:hypothetical protein